MTSQPLATRSSRKPLLNGLFWYVIIPFLTFHGLVALVSETERSYQISHQIIGIAPQLFCDVLALCVVGNIVVFGFLLDRFHHKGTFLDVVLMLFCGVLAGLSLRGLYLACV